MADRSTGQSGVDVDEIEGRAEESAGSLTGADGLKEEGTMDRTVSTVKQNVDRVADKVKGLLRSHM